MKPAPWTHLEPHRVAGPRGDSCGAFVIPHRGLQLCCIASDGGDWEHVSVSLKNRCPSWLEMDYVKDLFWTADETVMQLHVPKSEHINCHPHCLHLWRPLGVKIPLPPGEMV